jgi:hypothetical protein
MGLIVNDNVALTNGVTKTLLYLSFGNNRLSCMKYPGNSNYQVDCVVSVWYNKATRDAGGPEIDRFNLSMSMTPVQLDSSIYANLYTELATRYTSTTAA